jgi:hypothetical protein
VRSLAAENGGWVVRFVFGIRYTIRLVSVSDTMLLGLETVLSS